MLPAEIWQRIAAYIPPNPLTYQRLSEVCTASHAAFTSDHLWRALTPVESPAGHAKYFSQRIADAPKATQSQIRRLWREVEAFDYWGPPPDLQGIDCTCADLALPYTLLAAARAFKGRGDFGDFDLSDFEDSESEGESEGESESAGAPPIPDLPLPLALAAVTLWGPVLAHAPTLQANPEVVRAAVSTRNSLHWTAPETDGHALRFAAALQSNQEIVRQAIIGDGLSFEFASPALQKDPAFVESLAKQNGTVLAFASPRIRSNKKILLESIKGSGLGLAYASHDLKGDRELVLLAVKTRGASLRDALPRLRIDKEIIEAALENDPFAEKYVPEDIEELREMLGVAYLPPKEPRPLI